MLPDAGRVPTLTLNEVAGLLQMPEAQFKSRRGQLYARGFPRPLPSCGSIWSKRLVLDWIDSGGNDATRSVTTGHDPAPPETTPLIEEHRRRQRERYGIS